MSIFSFSEFILFENVRDDIIRDEGEHLEEFAKWSGTNGGNHRWGTTEYLNSFEELDPSNTGNTKRNQSLKWIVKQVLDIFDESKKLSGLSAGQNFSTKYISFRRALTQFKENREKLQKRDLNQYKDYRELEGSIERLRQSASEKKRKTALRSGGAREIYKDDDVEIISPNNYQMARDLAEPGNRWCVASSSASQWFPDYTSYEEEDDNRLPLYYITFSKRTSLSGDGQHFAWAVGGDTAPRDMTDTSVDADELRDEMGEDAWQAMMGDNGEKNGGKVAIGKFSERHPEDEWVSVEERVNDIMTHPDEDDVVERLTSIEPQDAVALALGDVDTRGWEKEYFEILLKLFEDAPYVYDDTVKKKIIEHIFDYGRHEDTLSPKELIGIIESVFYAGSDGQELIGNISQLYGQDTIPYMIGHSSTRNRVISWEAVAYIFGLVSEESSILPDDLKKMSTEWLYSIISNYRNLGIDSEIVYNLMRALLKSGADVNRIEKKTSQNISDIIDAENLDIPEDIKNEIKSETVRGFKYAMEKILQLSFNNNERADNEINKYVIGHLNEDDTISANSAFSWVVNSNGYEGTWMRILLALSTAGVDTVGDFDAINILRKIYPFIAEKVDYINRSALKEYAEKLFAVVLNTVSHESLIENIELIGNKEVIDFYKKKINGEE